MLEAQWPVTASPFVPADHWSYAVLRRLDNIGKLPPGADVARRTMPQEEIAALLTYALQQDSSGRAAGYLHKFREEFAAPGARGLARLDASGAALYQREYGRVRAGVGYDTVWTGVRPQDDESDVVARARTAIALAPAAAALAVESGRITELQLVLASSAVGLWAGRRELGYSSAHGGGILLDTHRFDALDNVLTLNGEQNDVEPFFWSARASI